MNFELATLPIMLAELFIEIAQGPAGAVLFCAGSLVGLGVVVWLGVRWFHDNATEGF